MAGTSAIPDPVTARVLLALAGDRVLPASMLAMEAGVSVAALRLPDLLDAGLVASMAHGRHRYYRLAGTQAAALAEAAAQRGVTIASLRPGTKANILRQARHCYRHLAGRLGCALTDALLKRGHLAGHDGSIDLRRLAGSGAVAGTIDPIGYTLTDSGAALLDALGGQPLASRRVRCCVDWTEQRHHVAGALGRHLTERLEQHGWIRRGDHHRTVLVTPAGEVAFADWFGIDVSALPGNELPGDGLSGNGRPSSPQSSR